MPHKFLLAVVSIILMAPLPQLQADDAVELPDQQHFHLYLLMGQSNMAGRGKLDDEADHVHPRVLKFSQQQKWTAATDPLHFDKPIAGVGLGTSFGRAMAKANPGVTIGLVPCAVGGTPLSRWQPEGDLYQQAVARIQVAMKDGSLKGILWHQGESDAADRDLAFTYAERLATMIRRLRRDLQAPDVPFVAGQLGRFLPDTRNEAPYHWQTVNDQLASLTSRLSSVAVVESNELDHNGDFVHFDAPSLRVLGQRYADAMRTLQLAPAPPKNEVESNSEEQATHLLPLTPDSAQALKRAEQNDTIEISPVHLPSANVGACNHFGWPIATIVHDTIVVMHRRIPGHNPQKAGAPDPSMSYGIVLRSQDGGQTWSSPYDLRDCMRPEDRLRGGLVPLSHRAKFDKQNNSRQGYKVHLHAIGTTRDNAVVAINNHGVFRSDDAGNTWRHFSTALRDDTFPHEILNLGPRLIDHSQHGLLAFGNWFGEVDSYHTLRQQFVVLRSHDGGECWQVEEHAVGFPQYEPSALLHDDRLLFVTRDQTNVRSHQQISWRPGQQPRVITTNLQDPRYVDTVDFYFNPFTSRFEIVRSERHHMELWLWSLDPADWNHGQWRRECRLLATTGKFYATADGFHPAGAVLDESRGVQHLFIYSGKPHGPAGVFRLTRSLDTPKLVKAMAEATR